MITVTHVTKRFGKVAAVDDLNFSLAEGEALALWGSNGAGKTTLIRCVLGVVRFRGHIRVGGGYDVRKRGKQARSLIGYVPQELAFHDDVRLGAAMSFFARLHRASPDAALKALRTVGLGGHERKRVRDLSGGMKQRLALGVALLADPPLIILDEPTSNLDASGRGEVVDTLRGLKNRGKTLLFASHRPDEVITLADRVLVLERGRLINDTSPSELWPTESAVQTMRLYVTDGDEQAAAGLLQRAGHAVHLNGHGLCVAVPRDRKADPVTMLTRSEIRVRDFEILHDVRPPCAPEVIR
jgi:ABC-type multidrug transport system ATPase subunit